MLVVTLMLLMAGAEDRADIATLLKAYREKTRAEYRCAPTADPDEILVCGARHADRYRLPLISFDAGDPHHEGVYEQAERLQAKTTPCQDHGPYLIGCGMVGVSLTTGGRGTHIGGVRPLSP
ncbi:hypothetical protein [Sphingomonas sp. 28-63-12]|uniref:hypothetical protein n=1 Tax=Sphingomonas sp. 28-63-12 TaxID=1970434 RepID=UPI0035A92AA0